MRRALIVAVLAAVALAVMVQPASAVSVYCHNQVSPVTLSLQRTGMYTVKATTSAPINSTAHFYARANGTTTWTYEGLVHDSAGANVSLNVGSSSAVDVIINNYGDTGQVWYDGNGNTVAYCQSPIREVS